MVQAVLRVIMDFISIIMTKGAVYTAAQGLMVMAASKRQQGSIFTAAAVINVNIAVQQIQA